jgi:hypothetical protein
LLEVLIDTQSKQVLGVPCRPVLLILPAKFFFLIVVVRPGGFAQQAGDGCNVFVRQRLAPVINPPDVAIILPTRILR